MIKDREFFRQSLGLLTEDNRIYRHEGTKTLSAYPNNFCEFLSLRGLKGRGNLKRSKIEIASFRPGAGLSALRSSQ